MADTEKKQTGVSLELDRSYVRLVDVTGWEGNPKKHDLDAIELSINLHGFRNPIAINKRNGQLEAGHGRCQVLYNKFAKDEPAPAYIKVDKEGNWLIPAIIFDDTELQQHRYSLADNRTGELGGYDRTKLLNQLKSLQEQNALIGSGYDEAYINELDTMFKNLTGGMDDVDYTDEKAKLTVVFLTKDKKKVMELLNGVANQVEGFNYYE